MIKATTEKTISQIKQLLYEHTSCNNYGVRIITGNTWDVFAKKQITPYYISSIVYIDEYNNCIENVFAATENTNRISTKAICSLCGCDAEATGKTINTALNKLYKLCKKMFKHKYKLYPRQ